MSRAARAPASTLFAALALLAVGALLPACEPEDAPVWHDPKGRSSFYLADQETDNLTELFEVGKTPGVSRKLSGDLAESSFIRQVTPGPRGRHVAYLADQDEPGSAELFVTRLKTGVNRKANAEGTTLGDNVQFFRFGPRERFLYYSHQEPPAEEGASAFTRLYRFDLKTDVRERLHEEFGVDTEVTQFHIGPRGKALVYVADQDIDNVYEAYHVDLKSLVVTKIHEDLGALERVGTVRWGDRGRFVYFTANPESSNRFELFRFDVKKKTTLKLSGPLTHEFGVSDFDFDRKGRYVVYSARQDSAMAPELYRTRIKDMSNAKLSPDAEEVFFAHEFEIDRRGRTVIHESSGSGMSSGLWSADLDDGEHTPLHAELGVVSFQLGPRGRFLTYETGTDELFGLKLKKPEPRLLSGEFSASLLCSFIGQKGRYAYYIDASSGVPDAPGDVYRTSLKKDDLLLLNTGIEDVHAGSIDPRERFVTFIADVGDGQELYRSRTKDGEVTKLTPTLVKGGDVKF